jgi:hypothetical protein
LYTDAPDIGLDAVLMQKDPTENERPVCFLSRKLQGAEVNYPTVKKELLAVVYSLSKQRKYLNESDFLLVPTTLLYAFVPQDRGKFTPTKVDHGGTSVRVQGEACC